MVNVENVKQAMKMGMPVASVSTPFKKDGSIDYRGLRNYIDFIVEAGTGLVLLTYGDSLFSILTDNEIVEVTKIVVEQTRKRALVVAATGLWWTGECVKFAQYTREIGADILMSLPPNWADSSNANTLKNHYTAISKEMPVMIVTALGAGNPVPLEVLRELLDEDNAIVAIKDDICGSYGRRMASTVNGRWAILSGGLKENHLDIMPYGVDGYLSVYMRFRPDVAHLYWNSIKNGDMQIALNIINHFERPFMEDMTQKLRMDFDSLIHASMEIYGICERWRRLPYKSLDDDQMEILEDFLTKLTINKSFQALR